MNAALAMVMDDEEREYGESPAWQAPWIDKREFVVPAANLPELQENIAKLNRRARRLGCPEIKITIGPARTVEKTQTTVYSFTEQKTRTLRVKAHDVTLIGERPKLPGGWHLAGRVQLLDGVSILHTVPGETVPSEYHNTTNRCDHCGHNRTRNDVYVIRSDDGKKHMVVGSTCIADFLGGITPAQMAWYAESLATIDARSYEDVRDGREGRGIADMDIERFLIASATAIRLVGWIAKSAVKFSGGPSTSTYASEIYHGNLCQGPEHVTTEKTSPYGTPYPKIVPTEADKAEAEAAMTWARNIDPNTANDYLMNVYKVADLTHAPWNLSGIAASIISAYQREQGRLATIKHERKISQHIGTVGERLTRDLTVQRVLTIETRFGYSNIHMFKDADGNNVKWFASSEKLDEGKTYTVTGTVKQHGNYKGIAETVLTRCKAKAT